MKQFCWYLKFPGTMPLILVSEKLSDKPFIKTIIIAEFMPEGGIFRIAYKNITCQSEWKDGFRELSSVTLDGQICRFLSFLPIYSFFLYTHYIPWKAYFFLHAKISVGAQSYCFSIANMGKR